MTYAVVAIDVSLSAVSGVGAVGLPVNTGEARSAFVAGAMPDQLCRFADRVGVSVPPPVIGLPAHVIPVASAAATLVTVPPPPPAGGVAQVLSPRRKVVLSRVPVAVMSVTACVCEVFAFALSALCRSVYADSVPVIAPHAVEAETVAHVPSPRRYVDADGVPVAERAVIATSPVRSSVKLPADRVNVTRSVPVV